MPRDILRTGSCQLREEIGMRRAVNSWAGELAIWLALVGVDKSGKVRIFTPFCVDRI
jgi:hypothetical protein